MSDRVVLDAGVLGAISHPRANADLAQWFAAILTSTTEVIIAEVADYEVRRELIRAERHLSVERLDLLKANLTYLPITTSIMLDAAQLWAQARKQGRPTADPKELDCDVILAAQALSVGALVVTENIGHLSLFVESRRWTEVSPVPPNGTQSNT